MIIEAIIAVIILFAFLGDAGMSLFVLIKKLKKSGANRPTSNSTSNNQTAFVASSNLQYPYAIMLRRGFTGRGNPLLSRRCCTSLTIVEKKILKIIR